MRRVRAWVREHRDWPHDVWLLTVVMPLILAAVVGVFGNSWWAAGSAVIFYVLGVMGHRVWAATARYVEKRREFALIHRRDGLPPPDLP